MPPSPPQDTVRLPFFPLQLVVFPAEEMRLHIFEPRYKQLIADVEDGGKSFCIAPVIDKKVQDVGTEIIVKKIVHRYEDGRLDIIVQGRRAVQVLDYYPDSVGKLYPGGLVKPLQDIRDGDEQRWEKILAMVAELWTLTQIDKPSPLEGHYHACFELGHLISMDMQQELELLAEEHEAKRQTLLYGHLVFTLPTMRKIAEMQRRARLNGEFRQLISPPPF